MPYVATFVAAVPEMVRVVPSTRIPSTARPFAAARLSVVRLFAAAMPESVSPANTTWPPVVAVVVEEVVVPATGTSIVSPAIT